MTLLDIQQQFNKIFDIESIKLEVEDGLSTYLNNYEFLKTEFGSDLPENFEIKDLWTEYRYFKIYINKISNVPIFRVKYNVYLKGEELPTFWYEMEFDELGDVLDDYFDSY